MSKAVLISIHPKWCKLIESGEKVIEIRKGRPKLETPFKCYIYQTSSGKVGVGLFLGDGTEIMGRSVKNGTVIGEFTCERISDIMVSCSDPNMKGQPFPGTGLTDKEIMDYLGNGKSGYGWHISGLTIYDRPKALHEFEVERYPTTLPLGKPPQSWCYVYELEGDTHGMS